MTVPSVVLDHSHVACLHRDTVRPFGRFLVVQDTMGAEVESGLDASTFLYRARQGMRSRKTHRELEKAMWVSGDVTWSAIALRRESTPGWHIGDSLTNVEHSVVIVGRVGRFVVVNADALLVDGYLAALKDGRDRRHRPVPDGVLATALGGGDVRVAHQTGIHRPRSSRATARTSHGSSLAEAASPEDAFYVVTASKVDATAIFGKRSELGISLKRSSVWTEPTGDFDQFEELVRVIVECIDDAFSAPVQPLLPFQARRTADLSAVRGAFAVSTLPRCLLSEEVDDDLAAAAETLERADFKVLPASSPLAFTVEVAVDNHSTLTAVGRLVDSDDGVRLTFPATDQVVHDTDRAAHLRRALRRSELVAVHFASGHTWIENSVYEVLIPDARFPNWEWADFTGFDITREKPSDPQHLGSSADTSLFGWVVGRYGGAVDGSSTMLTCDDGPGEIADFVLLDIGAPEGPTVALIHVKAAGTSSPGREIAAARLEVVASQAQKNLVHATVGQLREALADRIDAPTWSDGHRLADGRRDMLDFLELLDAGTPVEVWIVQPHLHRAAYDRALAPAAADAQRLRLRQAEALLHEVRRAVTGRAADLRVVGAL